MNTLISWGLSPTDRAQLAQDKLLADARIVALNEADLDKRLEQVAFGRQRSYQDLGDDPVIQQALRRVPDLELARIESMMRSSSPPAKILPQLAHWQYLLLLLPRDQISPAITAIRRLLSPQRLIFSAVTPLALSWFTGDYLVELQQEHLLMQQWKQQKASTPKPGNGD